MNTSNISDIWLYKKNDNDKSKIAPFTLIKNVYFQFPGTTSFYQLDAAATESISDFVYYLTINNGYIDTDRLIENGSLNGLKIKDKTIAGVSIMDGVITGRHLEDDVIETIKIKDNAISTSKIKNRAVTRDKLETDIMKDLYIICDTIIRDHNGDPTLSMTAIRNVLLKYEEA